MSDATHTSTLDLKAAVVGDAGARARLLEDVYQTLHDLAEVHLTSERANHTLRTTDLAHQAWLKLIDQRKTDFNDLVHFRRVASEAIRRILVDHARRRQRPKHGGDVEKISLDLAPPIEVLRDFDHLQLDGALRELESVDARLAKVVVYRFYGGFSEAEVAELMGVSRRTVSKDWFLAKSWLKRSLTSES